MRQFQKKRSDVEVEKEESKESEQRTVLSNISIFEDLNLSRIKRTKSEQIVDR